MRNVQNSTEMPFFLAVTKYILKDGVFCPKTKLAVLFFNKKPVRRNSERKFSFWRQVGEVPLKWFHVQILTVIDLPPASLSTRHINIQDEEKQHFMLSVSLQTIFALLSTLEKTFTQEKGITFKHYAVRVRRSHSLHVIGAYHYQRSSCRNAFFCNSCIFCHEFHFLAVCLYAWPHRAADKEGQLKKWHMNYIQCGFLEVAISARSIFNNSSPSLQSQIRNWPLSTVYLHHWRVLSLARALRIDVFGPSHQIWNKAFPALAEEPKMPKLSFLRAHTKTYICSELIPPAMNREKCNLKTKEIWKETLRKSEECGMKTQLLVKTPAVLRL